MAGRGGVVDLARTRARSELGRSGFEASRRRRYDPVKRAMDLVGSALALVLLSPLLLVLGVAIRLSMGGPVLFRQVRPGLHGQLFTICKFRTMSNRCDENGALLEDGHRITRLGRLMRATSLDELPALLNVLKGDMSLVGPRPLLVQYLEHYDARQRIRHDVLPGLTGLAQVRGRNALSWPEKFEFDVAYVENRSLRLDLEILVETVWRVLRRDGIASEGSATCPVWEGNAGAERADPTASRNEVLATGRRESSR